MRLGSNCGTGRDTLIAKEGSDGNDGNDGNPNEFMLGSFGNDGSKDGIEIGILKAKLGIDGNDGNDGNPRDPIDGKEQVGKLILLQLSLK